MVNNGRILDKDSPVKCIGLLSILRSWFSCLLIDIAPIVNEIYVGVLVFNAHFVSPA